MNSRGGIPKVAQNAEVGAEVTGRDGYMYCQMVSDDCRSPHFPSVTTTSSTTHDHIFCNSRIFGIQTSTPAAKVSTSIALTRLPSLPSRPTFPPHEDDHGNTHTHTHSARRLARSVVLVRSCEQPTFVEVFVSSIESSPLPSFPLHHARSMQRQSADSGVHCRDGEGSTEDFKS